jgi:hypothetical protein
MNFSNNLFILIFLLKFDQRMKEQQQYLFSETATVEINKKAGSILDSISPQGKERHHKI